MAKTERKFPYLQLYTQDLLRDCAHLSIEAFGCWVKILCWMHQSAERGVWRSDSVDQMARSCGITPKQARAVLKELRSPNNPTGRAVADYEDLDDGAFCIRSRRMIRDHENMMRSIEHGKQGGNPTLKTPSTVKEGVNPPDNPTDNGWHNPSANPAANGGLIPPLKLNARGQKPEARSQIPDSKNQNAAAAAEDQTRPGLEGDAGPASGLGGETAAASASDGPAVLWIECAPSGEWPVTQRFIDQLVAETPGGVDVVGELRKLATRCRVDPKSRRPHADMPLRCVQWVGYAVNDDGLRGKPVATGAALAPKVSQGDQLAKQKAAMRTFIDSLDDDALAAAKARTLSKMGPLGAALSELDPRADEPLAWKIWEYEQRSARQAETTSGAAPGAKSGTTPVAV